MSARLFYPIKEIFLTLQGEGAHAGARAVFLRVSGCNVWSGREQDRARDVAKGCCAAWCDTDFFGTDGGNGGRLTAKDIATKVRELWGPLGKGIVVVTGGEPSLVLDAALVRELQSAEMSVHVETNGSKELPSAVDWVTLSPKPPMPVVDQRYDEVKCVYPAGFNPEAYASRATSRFIQPLDPKNISNPSTTHDQIVAQCIAFIHDHPSTRWQLSLQQHKQLGLP